MAVNKRRVPGHRARKKCPRRSPKTPTPRKPKQLSLKLGRLSAPRSTSYRFAEKPATPQHNAEEKPARKAKEQKQYPPVPEGYELIFRMSREDKLTKKIIRSKRPMPMIVPKGSVRS